jgi:MoaA/NifB/PqqE/SkfB family radical SAM enzyme
MNARLETLPILILYPHSRCNCRCVMCDIWKTDNTTEISATDLERHLVDIEALHVQRVVFSGGEPLMHSDLFRFCGLLRARGIRTTILSTGLLLERNAQLIIEHVDDVIVSLDGPPDIHDPIRRVKGAFAKLAQGVRAIHELDASFPISARCTVQRENHFCIRETAKMAKALRLSSISFLAADVTSEAFNRPGGWELTRQQKIALDESQISTLEDQLEQLSEEWKGSGFVLENREKLARIVLHYRAHLGLCEPVAPRCNAPWVSAVVETDGTVRPCFFHAGIGALNGHGLFEVLNGPQALQFRRELDVASNPICRRCVCSLNWQGV